MLKVIIADDEVRLCRLVQLLADWDALGMEVSGCAYNGLEALALVEEQAPHVLITDIRMPGCDGLELIEKARALSPNLEVIIISGYAQFEYAQAAIRQGVSGYLLKPIKKTALTAALLDAGSRIRERIRSNLSFENLVMDNRRSHGLLRERLIDDIIAGRMRAKTARELEEEYGVAVPEAATRIFLLKMDYDYSKAPQIQMELAKKHVEELFAALVAPKCTLGVLHANGAEIYGMLNYAPSRREDIRHALRDFLNQLVALCRLFGGMEFSLALGRAVESAGELPISMREAKMAICERLVEGTGRLLEYREGEFSAQEQHEQRQILERYDRQIRKAIETRSRDEADKAVDAMAQETLRNSGILGREVFALAMTAAKMFALSLDAKEEERLSVSLLERYELCAGAKNLFECLKAFQREQLDVAQARRESETMRPIRLAKQYIGQHYSEPITLDDVCAKTGFSVGYFSTLFKKETGEGFSKYLVRIRIEHAKALLVETNLSVAEICFRVGYSDLKHFAGTFKKTTNLNPGQYRRLYG